jgi:hypothetical protein
MYRGPDSIMEELVNCWTEGVRECGRADFASESGGDSIQFATRAEEMVIGFRYAKNLNSKIRITVDGEVIDTVSNFCEDGAEGGYIGLYRIFCAKSVRMRSVVIQHLDDNLFFIDYVLYASRSSCLSAREGEIVNRLNF